MTETSTQPQTVAALRRDLIRIIGPASETAPLDARVIVAHLLGCVPAQLALRDDEAIDAATVELARTFAERRATGEPVARLTGEKEFWGLTLALAPETLVPRPDTETLVEAALARIDEDWSRTATLRLLDLGTGSGAILIALLSELPHSEGLGVDIQDAAIEAARANAASAGLGSRATFAAGDWTAKVRGQFDVVVSNPPYIRTQDIPGLPVDVRDHDPHVALDGGADGLDAIHSILADLGRVLAPGGVAFIEIGAGQADIVAELAEAHGFTAAFRNDLAGHQRVAILARKTEDPAA